ncbi:MAG: hypothetical protein NUW37_05895 [Planctomycetes bacterium]|nr:hypothetical protein [Planctomycetota bacterium]
MAVNWRKVGLNLKMFFFGISIGGAGIFGVIKLVEYFDETPRFSVEGHFIEEYLRIKEIPEEERRSYEQDFVDIADRELTERFVRAEDSTEEPEEENVEPAEGPTTGE